MQEAILGAVAAIAVAVTAVITFLGKKKPERFTSKTPAPISTRCTEHSGHETRLDALEVGQEKQWDHISDLGKSLAAAREEQRTMAGHIEMNTMHTKNIADNVAILVAAIRHKQHTQSDTPIFDELE